MSQTINKKQPVPGVPAKFLSEVSWPELEFPPLNLWNAPVPQWRQEFYNSAPLIGISDVEEN